MLELLAKLGKSGSIRWIRSSKTVNPSNRRGHIGNYVVSVDRSRSVKVYKEEIKKMWYSGKVWCPSVPPHENVLVERNGKSVFCGNTKYGDGGVDILPIGHLYKTEVRSLAARLRVPYEIVMKPSSPNLWPGHKASQELPADYDVLDRVLTLLFDSKKNPSQIVKETGYSKRIIRDVIKLNMESSHKRQVAPAPS
jgi:hypothetical protein